jgi:Fe-S-cluster containining protein
MSSGCTTCSGECCRKYLVHLSGRDAVTIARGQGLAFESFIDIISEDGPSSKGFILDDSGDAYALCLQRRQDGACSFLMALTDGSQRCGIYPERPLTCSVFPLRLFHGSVDIRPDVICEPSGRRITTVDLPAGRARLIRASFEWSVYAHVVAAWNAAHAHVAGRLHENLYFAYVGAAYDAIDAALEERQPATATIIDRWIDSAPALDDAAGAQRRDLEQALDDVLAQIAAR